MLKRKDESGVDIGRVMWTKEDERLFRVLQLKAKRKESVVCTIAEASDAIEYERDVTDRHCKAMQWAVMCGEQGILPCPDLIKDLHARMFGGTGEWRTRNIYRPGWSITFADCVVIEEKLEVLCTKLEEWADNHTPFWVLARFHLAYEMVHPHDDGNGRVGRALLCIIGTALGVGCIRIPPERRREYFKALSMQRIDLLESLLQECTI